jgi:2-octaprenyl-6-methoxyphenol hydroxylase
MTQHSDVIIIGGGLVGMALALALDAHGMTSAVIDTADLDTTFAPGFDGRASAISSASVKMLSAIGIGDAIASEGCPIREIRVTDGLSPLHLHFDGHAEETPLGVMFENRVLRASLIEAGRRAANVAIHAPARAVRIERGEGGVAVTLHDGTELRAPLVVAAEGRRSPLRDAAGIRIGKWQYGHRGIVTMIEHEANHGNVAFELFYPTGPFAILPMNPGTRSGIVWSVPEGEAEGWLALPKRALAAEFDKRMGGFLGKFEFIAPVQTWPLGFHHAERYVDHRLVLVGDSAHGIHPIAGQGFNLGLRDAAALAEVLVESARLGLDLGSPAVLERYQRWRRLDAATVAGVGDLLVRLFGVPGKPAAAVRRLGLAAVERLSPLKTFFMAEARGQTGDLPKLLQGALA